MEHFKKCPGDCNGKGWYLLKDTSGRIYIGCAAVPRFIRCEWCKGAGVVEMTEDEILQERDARIDHEADLRNDI